MQVLADDLNQDYMRSIVAVLKCSRIFVGKYVPLANCSLKTLSVVLSRLTKQIDKLY